MRTLVGGEGVVKVGDDKDVEIFVVLVDDVFDGRWRE